MKGKLKANKNTEDAISEGFSVSYLIIKRQKDFVNKGELEKKKKKRKETKYLES